MRTLKELYEWYKECDEFYYWYTHQDDMNFDAYGELFKTQQAARLAILDYVIKDVI